MLSLSRVVCECGSIFVACTQGPNGHAENCQAAQPMFKNVCWSHAGQNHGNGQQTLDLI